MSSIEEYVCHECSRKYCDFSKYQTHVKIKHSKKKLQVKYHTFEDDLKQMEDKIYTFLGELAQFHIQNARPTDTEGFLQDLPAIRETNYTYNLIVRTPHEPEINVANSIPTNYLFSPTSLISLPHSAVQQTIASINAQIKQLSQKLDEQRLQWQFADPNNKDIDFANQFSILNIAALIRNYSNRKINLKRPQISIYLIWIGRVCKPEMFKLVYELITSHYIFFEDYIEVKKIASKKKATKKTWCLFLQHERTLKDNVQTAQQVRKKSICRLRNFYASLNKPKIEVSKLEQLINYFDQWSALIKSQIELISQGSM